MTSVAEERCSNFGMEHCHKQDGLLQLFALWLAGLRHQAFSTSSEQPRSCRLAVATSGECSAAAVDTPLVAGVMSSQLLDCPTNIQGMQDVDSIPYTSVNFWFLQISTGYSLRSSTRPSLSVPGTRTVTASRGFSSAAPSIWSELPDSIVACKHFKTFKAKLKTFYFEKPYLPTAQIHPTAPEFIF